MAFNKKPIETKENKKSTKNNILTDKQNNKKVSNKQLTNNKIKDNKVSNNNKKQPIINNKQEKPIPKFIKGGKNTKKKVADKK